MQENKSENQKTEEATQKRDEMIHEEIYDSTEYISAPKRVQDGTVPMNILNFQYPFNFIYNIYMCIYTYTRTYNSLHNICKSFIFI